MHTLIKFQVAFFIFAGMFFFMPLNGQSTFGEHSTLSDTIRARELIDQANNLMSQMNWGEALGLVEEGKRIYEEVLNPKSEEIAKAYYMIGVIHYKMGNYSEAMQPFKNALAIQRELWGESNLDVAKTYNWLGIVSSVFGLYSQGLDYFQRSLDIKLEILNEFDEDLAASYNSLGYFHYLMGNNKLAKKHHEKALAIRLALSGDADLDVAASYNHLGLISQSQNDYDKAIQYYEKALAIRLAYFGNSHPSVAQSLTNIGASYDELKRYPEAIQYYDKALAIYLEWYGDSHPATGNVYNNLGNTYMHLGDNKQSVFYHEKAQKIWLENYGDSHPDVGISLSNLGNAYNELGDFDQAIQCHERAISILQKNYGDVHPYLSIFYFDLGEVYSNTGDYKRAIQLKTKAVQGLGYSGMDSLANISSFSTLLLGLTSIGQEYYFMYLQSKDQDHLYQSQYHVNKALEALDFRTRSLGADTRSTLSEDAYSIANVAIPTCFLLYQATDSIHYLKTAMQFLERSKSYALFQALQRADALRYAGIPQNLIDLENDLRIDISYYDNQRQHLWEEGASKTDTSLITVINKLFDLNKTYHGLIDEFEANYPEYYHSKYDLSTIGAEEIQQNLLAPKQTLLEYFTGDSSIYIFVVNPDDFQVFEVKRDFPLNEWVEELRSGLYGYYSAEDKSDALFDQTSAQYIKAGQALYQKLVQPVERLLNESVKIVPDGILGYLPFEALLKNKPSDPLNFATYPYLIKDYSVSYTYSATLLKEMVDKKHHTEPAASWLGFAPFYSGGYQYVQDLFDKILTASDIGLDADSLGLTLRSRKFDPLPNSAEEMAIGGKLWNGKFLLGKDATEEQFKNLAGQYRMLHLSTHGLADSRVGDYSYLAFAEVPDSIENELLYVRDLYNLQLNADLVVLSACETGVGELQRGEGIISLARAFAYAGAKSIVTSLWEVGDASTKELLKYFYVELKKGKTKDEALRMAKLKYLKKFSGQQAHPFFWAGFIGIGDMGSISLD